MAGSGIGGVMEFRLLGPVGWWVAGAEVDLGPPRQRCVVAALLLTDARPLATGALIRRVWGERPPARASDILYTYVARVRRVLRTASGVCLAHGPSGYILEVDPDAVDAHRFDRLVAAAAERRGETAPTRVRLLRDALSLWRGTPLEGLSGDWVERTSGRLERRRLDVLATCLGLELDLGRHADVLDELSTSVAAHPTAEPLVGQLMLALYRCGLQAEALATFRDTRRVLIDEHGLEPGHDLRRLEHAILVNDPVLQVPGGRTFEALTVPSLANPRVPAQLPGDVAGFAGRIGELAQLDKLLPGVDKPATAVAISVVSGTAGVGKTALAVHWAHRVADRFPDGQLYLNMRGFDPSGVPMDPADGVRALLDALGVSPQRIPASLDGQVGLYRSLLAGRRVLIVLDNARNSEQVRPLLPGAAGCVAIVTSRDYLSGLVATECAYPVAVEPLSTMDSRALLIGRLGHDRAAAEPAAIARLIAWCAGLPVALAVVAAHAAGRPDLALARLTDELSDSRGGLDTLASGDPATDLCAVFSWSYRQLGGDAGRLFRLLSLHPGPEVAADAAASLAGHPVARTSSLLRELTRAHLVFERTPGRYALHDLIRLYATELAQTVDSDTDRRTAVRRLVDSYLQCAHAAATLLNPNRDAISVAPPGPGVSVTQLADRAEALAWFRTERSALLVAIESAAEHELDAQAWQLAWAAGDFLDRQGRWHDWAAAHQTALRAAVRLGDPRAQAYAHRGLGGAYARLARYDESRVHQRKAIDMFGRIGDHVGRARGSLNLAHVWGLQGRHRTALHHAKIALAGYEAAGDRAGQARALNSAGWYHGHIGEHQQAIDCCERALGLAAELDDAYLQGATWDTLGYAHQRLHQYQLAIAAYRRSIDFVRTVGDRADEAGVLIRLGDALALADHASDARKAWLDALEILLDLADPGANEVHAKLSRLDNRA